MMLHTSAGNYRRLPKPNTNTAHEIFAAAEKDINLFSNPLSVDAEGIQAHVQRTEMQRDDTLN